MSFAGTDWPSRKSRSNILRLSRRHLLPRLPRQLVPGLPWLRARGIERAVRRLEPAARQFAFRKIGRDFTLAFARCAHRRIGSDILEDDDPIGVVLSISANRLSTLGPATSRSCGSGSVRKRSFAIRLVCVGGICANTSGGTYSSTLDACKARPSAAPSCQIELGPLRFRQRPIGAVSPFVRAHDPICRPAAPA